MSLMTMLVFLKKSITTLQSYSDSYTDDFRGNFPLKIVCEITEPLMQMKFLFVASIFNIRQNLPWYYESCNKYGKKNNPSSQTQSFLYRPRQNFRKLSCLLYKSNQCTRWYWHHRIDSFDREAKRLLDISAYELKKIHEALYYIIHILKSENINFFFNLLKFILHAIDSDGLFPMQLNVLKNRKFGFLVDITSYNVEDLSIISELESKIELMIHNILLIHSVSLNQVSLESDDVVQPVQKDVISQTDESFTPSTVDKSTATSPSKISIDLKRNLQDIYDVDSGDDLSSTKAKRKSIGEETPLLVPKDVNCYWFIEHIP
uniref:Uncharacterized protein n=1 Tax=Lactuca sativa TaxID=4236 RepID=A0A9R1WX06_LACSA|nr:hypothetical protein LSAT_V11C800442120 [Lactuca sativa]